MGFPSRAISIVAEKFSSGKDSIRESKRERGRRMVAEELKLSRVDVKERQQKFENMSQSKDPKVNVYMNRGCISLEYRNRIFACYKMILQGAQ